MEVPPQLSEAVRGLTDGTKGVVSLSPRELLGWFGRYRRTWRQIQEVNSALRSCGVYAEPDFEGAGYDDQIELRLRTKPGETPIAATNVGESPSPPETPERSSEPPSAASINLSRQQSADPVHRVSRFLPPARLISVARDQSIKVATTLMLLHDYSQLPVMQGERGVVGMISWQSIGRCRAFGANPLYVRDCLTPHYEVKADDSIFEAIRFIQEFACVLVRSADNRIVGILTATDISGWFEQLSRPFLFLSYVENHLRALIQPRFSVGDLQLAKDPADSSRQITDVSDMNFGEYIPLLESPGNWEKLGIAIERALFVSQLNEVREIRNGVMHFNPEGIEDDELDKLRKFNSFIQSLVSILPKT